jgi:hypothetical protein
VQSLPHLRLGAKIDNCSFLMPTMNIPDLLPSLYHDANQDSSPVGESGATPTSAADSTPVENTPIQQRRLFAEASSRESNDDDDKENEDDHNKSSAWLLGRIQNQSQELDMTVVKKEAEEDSDRDSNCSASKVQDFLESYKETSKERCGDIAVLEDDDDIVCGTGKNMIETKRGL